MTGNAELFAGYIPVIHDGYIRAFNRHPNATIGIFDTDIISEMAPYLRKDIRALSPQDAKNAIIGLGRDAIVIDRKSLEELLEQPVIMPDDDISRSIIKSHLNAKITTEPVFLRWDRDNSAEESSIKPDRILEIDEYHPLISAINEELSHSTNWWRHVGAIVHDDENKIIFSEHNSPLPNEYTTLMDSDPRITAHKGEAIERSVDIHAEARIIAEASKQGIALKGLSMCVSTFPCPNCAKLIALSGIKACYYIDGYAMLDGFSILKDFDVEVVKLETKLASEDPNSLKSYPIAPPK